MFRLFLCLTVWLFVFATAYPQTCDIVPADQNAAKTAVKIIFQEISRDLVDRLEKYYVANGRYASRQENVRFGDIGLNPADWEGNNFEGIVYAPAGNTLEVYPAEGYTFFVDEPNGNTQILSWDIRWPLVYNLTDKKWYFHEIAPDTVVDVSTLHVKKDSPYNPQEYEK